MEMLTLQVKLTLMRMHRVHWRGHVHVRHTIRRIVHIRGIEVLRHWDEMGAIRHLVHCRRISLGTGMGMAVRMGMGMGVMVE